MVRHTDVAVIGSGFSAVALSLNLLDVLPPTAQVSLVGPTERQGRGVAYSTRLDCHLLNVPAGRMSLYADRPDHFVRWLAENGHAGGDDSHCENDDTRGFHDRSLRDAKVCASQNDQQLV